jgi:hypothetical protein
MGPLLYLSLCSMKNRTRVRLKRLREPKYLIGSLFGAAYFYFLLWRPKGSSTRAGGPGGVLAMITRGRAGLELAGSAVLFVVAALAWVWPGSNRPALAFTRADVQFLFTAPISRRRLIRYKVLRTQLGTVFGSAIMTMFFRPTSLAGGWMFFAGTTLLMSILGLHLTGVSLSRQNLGKHGVAGLARQWVPVALVVGAVVALTVTVWTNWARLGALGASGGDVLGEVERLGSTGVAGIVLLPFRAIVRMPLAASPTAFLAALPWALLILALNYVWVLRADVAFEEASAELAEKIARVRKGTQPVARKPRGAVSTPFALSLKGRPEMAILWKNLILLGRYVSLKLVVRLLPAIIFAAVMLSRGGRHGGLTAALAGTCLVLAGMAVMLGPLMMRNDLRQDLANLAVLKTWPVRGAALVRGEVLAPAIVLSTFTWLAVIAAACLSSGLPFARDLPILERSAFALAAMLVAPGVILVQLLVQNGLAVMFPSWVTIGPQRGAGIDVMGQRMLMMFGALLAMLVAILPAAILGGLAGFLYSLATGTFPVLLPAVLAAFVLVVEGFVVSEAIGRVLDRTDVTAVDAAE